MSEEKYIPKHWQVKKLIDIGEIVSGGTPSTKVSEYWDGNISWISPADLSGYSQKTIQKGRKSITDSGLKNSSSRMMPKGSVLFSSRAPIGYVVIAGNDICTNQGFKSIVPNKSIFNEYLYYFLKASKQEAEKVASGTTFKEISLKAFAQLEIPLPPFSDQKAIVSKIEELLSDLENGKQQLKLAQQQLKIYRQSILKWAFVNGSFKDYILKEATDKIQIGPFGTQLHKEDYIENGIPLINPMHIQEGNIQADYSYSITKEKRDSLPNYILKEGDVILGRRGEMGRCGLVRKKESGWFCGTGSLYVRPDSKKLNSLFLYYFLSSQPVKKYLNDNAGGTTMANLNLKIVNEIPISLPPLVEQQLIVDELESKLTVCDKIEETISQSLLQAESLRQSILKKAFEGKLV
jgi:type I restriction enzyme S subunit